MTDPGTIYKATAEGLKQGTKIANQGAKIAEAAYKAKVAKEELRKKATAKYTINIRLTNSTPNQWTLPRAYFRQGTADHNPELRVEAKQETVWEVNSFALTSTGVEGVIAYTIAPNLALVVLFRIVRGSRFLVKKENAWGVEIVETSTLEKKNRVKLYNYLLKPENKNRGNCSAFSKTYHEINKPFTVIGAMANSDTPELVVHVRERSNTALARSMSAPPLPTTSMETSESTSSPLKRQRAESLPEEEREFEFDNESGPMTTMQMQKFPSFSSVQRKANLEALRKSAHLEMEGDVPELESGSSFRRVSSRAQVYKMDSS